MADLIYLETRALRYLTNWPNIGEHDAIQAVRLHTAGVVQSYKNPSRLHDNGAGMDDWKDHQSILTAKGMALLFYVRGQSFGYFTVGQILDLWPLSALKAKTPKSVEFLNLFMQRFNDKDIMEYIEGRKEEIRFTGLTPEHEHPFTGKPAGAILAALGVNMDAEFAKWQSAELERESAVSEALAGLPVDLERMTSEVIGAVVEEIYGADDDDADFGPIMHMDDINDPVLKHLATPEGEAQFMRDNNAAVDSEPPPSAEAQPACDYCEGTGVDPFEEGQPCPQCHGAKRIQREPSIAGHKRGMEPDQGSATGHPSEALHGDELRGVSEAIPDRVDDEWDIA